MSRIVNKFLLTGDKFMPEFLLRQPGFSYNACSAFTKHCEKIQKFTETGNFKIYIEMNQTQLVLMMMLPIMIVNIQLRELFQRKF